MSSFSINPNVIKAQGANTIEISTNAINPVISTLENAISSLKVSSPDIIPNINAIIDTLGKHRTSINKLGDAAIQISKLFTTTDQNIDAQLYTTSFNALDSASPAISYIFNPFAPLTEAVGELAEWILQMADYIEDILSALGVGVWDSILISGAIALHFEDIMEMILNGASAEEILAYLVSIVPDSCKHDIEEFGIILLSELGTHIDIEFINEHFSDEIFDILGIDYDGDFLDYLMDLTDADGDYIPYDSDTNHLTNTEAWNEYLENNPNLRYIEDQENFGDFRYGGLQGNNNLCGAIATYNALVSMGVDVNFADIVRYYEENSLCVNGFFGTSIWGINEYFTSNNYDVEMLAGSQINSDSLSDLENCDTFVINYFNDETSIQRGMHYVSITREGKKYVLHNAGVEDQTFTSLEAAVEAYNNGGAEPVCIYGISN